MAGNAPIRSLLAGIFASLVLCAPAAAVETNDARIEDFYGAYVGNSMIEGTLQFRDIIIEIKPIRNGFSVYTSTVIREGPQRAVRGVKWRSETQSFVQSDVSHVYKPLVRESMFTRKRDPDLLAGETLSWASIRGRTLGVYSINILDDGHYELRVFERSLTKLGIDLTFVRYNDGKPVLELRGVLAKAKTENDN